jgi:hypothetical protein
VKGQKCHLCVRPGIWCHLLVLRFLAEDVPKELNCVLDGILRSLSSPRTPMVPIYALNMVRGSGP